MRLDFLNEFIVLYDLLNFHEAANRLHVSKSTLSKHITALEAEVGATLFERSPNLFPTPAGEYFYDEAVMANEVFKHAAEKCSEISKRFPRFLRIGCLSGIEDESMALVKQTINQIQGRTSKKIILLELSLSPDRLFSDLVAGRRDFVLFPTLGDPSTVIEQFNLPDLESMLIVDEPVTILVDPKDRLAKVGKLGISDIATKEISIKMGRYNKTKPHVVIDLFSTYRLSPKIRLDTNDDMELSYLTPSKPNQIQVIPKSILAHSAGTCINTIPKELDDGEIRYKTYGFYKRNRDYQLFTRFREELGEVTPVVLD